jgi:hypothetical protein
MSSNEYEGATQPPGPDPALQRLGRFLGTWEVKGRTLGAEEDDVSGRLTFEWLPGGFFLQQRVQIDFMGLDVEVSRSSATTRPPGSSPRPSTRTWSASPSRTSTTCRATA